MHSFPAQGATVSGTATLAGHCSQSKHETYVGDTRAIYRHSVHVAREDLGVDGHDDDRLARYAQRISENRERRASIHYALDPRHHLAVTLPDNQPLPHQLTTGDIPPARHLVAGRAGKRQAVAKLREIHRCSRRPVARPGNRARKQTSTTEGNRAVGVGPRRRPRAPNPAARRTTARAGCARALGARSAPARSDPDPQQRTPPACFLPSAASDQIQPTSSI
jgi:hypothetical protein